MDKTKLEMCKKCWGTGHVNGGDENSTWSKSCEDCHGIGFIRVPQTNADRIRAMSDEELEDFLLTEEWMCDTYNSCSVCPLRGEKGCISILEWLKQPAEE